MVTALPQGASRRRRLMGAVGAALLAVPLVFAGGAAAGPGDITTVAGIGLPGTAGENGPAVDAHLTAPVDVVFGTDGSYLLADQDQNRVRRVDASGKITTVAGAGGNGFSGDGGPARVARLNAPSGIARGRGGVFYIADTGNRRVRRVDAAGTITTIAGTGAAGSAGDGGRATDAQLVRPVALILDRAGNLLIADAGAGSVRRVDVNGIITTVASAATGVALISPSALDLDLAGRTLIADSATGSVLVLDSSGSATPLPGTGPGTFAAPMGLAVDAAGDVFVSDEFNHRIHRVGRDGTVSTLAGTGTAGFSGDGGPATASQLSGPRGLAHDGNGNVLVADTENHRIRRLEAVAVAINPPVLTSTSPPSPSNQNVVRVLGTAQEGMTVELFSDAACAGSPAARGPAAVLAEPGIPATVADNTTTRFFARAVTEDDLASVCSPTSVVYSEDSLPPAAPTITAAPATPSPNTTPAWFFSTSTDTAEASCELSRDGVVLSPFESCSGGLSYDLSAQPDGVYLFAVRGSDSAGNVGAGVTSAFELDRTAPAAPMITSAPASPTNESLLAWTVEVPADATAMCELWAEDTVVVGPAGCERTVSHDVSGFPDGAFLLQVWAEDRAGNVSAPATSRVVVDRVLPAAPVVTASPVSPGAGTTPAWWFTGDGASTTECSLRSAGVVVVPFEPCSDALAFDLSGQPDGIYELVLRAVDLAGNSSPEATSPYSLDRTAPAVPAILVQANPPPGSLVWSFDTDPDASTTCELWRESNAVMAAAPCAETFTFKTSGHPDGTYRLQVVAVDEAGNRSASSSEQVLARPSTPPAAEALALPPPATASPSPPAPATNAAEPATTAVSVQSGLPDSPPAGQIPPAPQPDSEPTPQAEPETPAAVAPRVPERPPVTSPPGPEAPVVVQMTPATDALRDALAKAAARSAFPLTLLLALLLFVILQDRIDHRDPKLAYAPVRSDDLPFRDPDALPLAGPPTALAQGGVQCAQN